mmetsp:Transcript_14012/g.52550  ORF Transcript_14012/g.52550 Transcript_14012/m.52550 type:complete len:269 (-) Transcript_14012:1649-2455(-)
MRAHRARRRDMRFGPTRHERQGHQERRAVQNPRAFRKARARPESGEGSHGCDDQSGCESGGGGGGGGGVGGRCVDDAANAFDADSRLTSDITRVSIHPERTQRRGRRRGGAVARRGSARRVGRFVTRVRYTTKTATRRVRGGRARHSHRVRSPVALGVLRGAEGAAHVFFATGAGKPERASSLPVGLINGHELRTLSARRESSAGRRAVAVSLPRAPRARRRGGEGARGHRRGESSHQPRARHGRHVRRRRRQGGFRVRRRGGAGASD